MSETSQRCTCRDSVTATAGKPWCAIHDNYAGTPLDEPARIDVTYDDEVYFDRSCHKRLPLTGCDRLGAVCYWHPPRNTRPRHGKPKTLRHTPQPARRGMNKLKWGLISLAIVLALMFLLYTVPRWIWGTGLDLF